MASKKLDRPTIWLGDLGAMVEGDIRFLTARAEAVQELTKASTDTTGFHGRYMELTARHATMVTEFNGIADKLEEVMATTE